MTRLSQSIPHFTGGFPMLAFQTTKTSAFLMFLITIVAFSAIPAVAQTTHMGGFPQGQMVSRSAEVSPQSTLSLYTVPNDRILVLTTFCANGEVFLSSSSRGELPFDRSAESNSCISFSPGWVFQKGEELRCNNRTDNEDSCGISGILIKEGRKPHF